jgi:hypothetical protein
MIIVLRDLIDQVDRETFSNPQLGMKVYTKLVNIMELE